MTGISVVNNEMYAAIRDEDAQALRAAIARGANVNVDGKWMRRPCPLEYAIKKASTDSSLECLRVLVDAGVDVEWRTIQKTLAGKLGSSRFQEDAAVFLLDNYTYNGFGSDKSTILILLLVEASRHDFRVAAKKLCEMGAHPLNAYEGNTPISVARSSEMGRLLMQACADIAEQKQKAAQEQQRLQQQRQDEYKASMAALAEAALKAKEAIVDQITFTQKLENGDTCVQVFDFVQRTRFTYFKSGELITAPSEKDFDFIAPDSLRPAFNVHKERGGTCDESVIYPQEKHAITIDGLEKPLSPPRRLASV